jgi:ribosomal-protein-alanine N-acetyltransferase
MEGDKAISVLSSKMRLRLADEQDVMFISSLSASSDDSLLPGGMLNSYIDQRRLHLIVEEDQPIGFLCESIVLDEAELLQIVIDNEFRKHGYAKQALDCWHDYLVIRKVVNVFLEVREGNIPAIRLYDKLGYKNIGVRKNYYILAGKKYHAVMMKKSLVQLP